MGTIVIIVIIIIIIKTESEVQGWEKVRTLSIRRRQPRTTNCMEEKDKIVGDRKEEQIRPTGGY